MKKALSTLALGALAASSSSAAEIIVASNITTSTTWTANNTYNIQTQIYVEPGATLTIQAGTVIASDTNVGGSIAVAKGAQIFVLGKSGNPVIFTSKADVATWTNGDPKTGTWRESANEWGNITIMGDAYIAENAVPTNSASPNGSNYANMEGLQPPAGSTIAQYGGANDDDDSGTLNYMSLRYGGKVIGLNNELNGLSLGGIGRGTDIDFVEIMNNVDDGIEIWGGTVSLKHFSIWNIGDDSLDIDQGWRGQAQFGLIVQGYSLDASQGSGVGDNCIEMDGAEDSDYQPVTTGALYNMTVIGQPVDGDGATAWRDNANMQIRNSIIMDCGEKVVRADGDDGDGASGYGHNGTLSFEDRWNTSAATTSAVNAPANPGLFYTAQDSTGNLIEISDTVFFRNLNGSAYTEAIARGVFDPSNNNVLATNSPVASITRATPVVRGGKTMLQCIGLDPTPINDAASTTASAPSNGFYEFAPYRGAFSPDTANNWLCGWSAANAFGFTDGDCVGAGFGEANANSTGTIARMSASGSATASDNDLTIEAQSLPQGSAAFFLTSQTQSFVPNPGGSEGNLLLLGSIGRYVGPGQIQNSGSNGIISLTLDLTQIPQPTGFVTAMAGENWNFQAWYRDIGSGGSAVSNFSNGLSVTFN
ncbi:MAG: hypothetical protein ISQ11_11775 [Planctomycetes bacterium]|nr:hypothetical protein [Planctomycetota bacterium]